MNCRKFATDYQVFFHHSFKVSDYLAGENMGLKDLIGVCPGVKVWMLCITLLHIMLHCVTHLHFKGVFLLLIFFR